MNNIWNIVMRPIIEGFNGKYIVQIGSDTPITRNILEYCDDNNAHMTNVTPIPGYDIDEFKIEYGNKFEIYTETVLSRLHLLEDYDVIILTLDDFSTIYSVLNIIENSSLNKNFPFIFLSLVESPYSKSTSVNTESKKVFESGD